MDATRRRWQARWIWTRGPLTQPFHFSYFRSSFDLAQAPAAASVVCAADSRYRLWVNGDYVGFGPARGHAKHPYYDTHAVKLRKGANTVAFLVEHYTNKLGIFAAVRGGLICEVEADGEVVAATDGRWRAATSRAYFPIPGRILPEGFDARREPEGWEQAGFDDRRWPKARVLTRSKLAPPDALLARPIPLIREQRVDPLRLLDVGLTRNRVHPDLARDTDVAVSLWECTLDRGKTPPMRPKLRPQ
ncbi:MAG TPA: alpha-L-rhamnosidase N-terminal domain-containing protein, partial [Planctomycetota bacterium]|nr:alpha-L-rhamnosidase N-terminal domain-containing protein [Planctomycetota bacterium]